MSKYIELKNKQRLANALAEIGMTVDEAKQWLQEASAQTKETPAAKPSADMDDVLDIAAYMSVWFKDHENDYPESAKYTEEEIKRAVDAKPPHNREDEVKEEPLNKCTNTCKETKKYNNIVRPCKVPEKDKSNVTFIPGNAQNKPLLIVGGVQVLGDFKACYSYDSTSGKSTLQVEFIDPI